MHKDIIKTHSLVKTGSRIFFVLSWEAARSWPRLAGKALADSLEDDVVLDVISVVGLQLGGDTGKCALKGLLGRGVDHLGLYSLVSGAVLTGGEGRYAHLNASVIGRPGDEGNLVAVEYVSPKNPAQIH